MLLVLPFFGLAFLLLVVGLLGPAVVDMIRREDTVPAWWSTPYTLLLLPMLGALAAPFLEYRPFDQAVLSAYAWFMVHLMAAGLTLALALGLAASRGLRPGAPTARRQRTTATAIAFLLATMAVPFFPFWNAGPTLAWLIPTGFAGLLWVVALNRRGPSRFERGKSTSAALLVASALQLMIALCHLSFGTHLDEPETLVQLRSGAVPAGVVLAVLVGGLRYLTGYVPPRIPALSAATVVTLGFPVAWWATRELPVAAQIPVWVDLAGRPGGVLGGVRDPTRCIWRPPADPPCTYDVLVVGPADVPLSSLPARAEILVGDGTRKIARWGRGYRDELRVFEVDGFARVGVDPKPYALGPELHALLAERGRKRPLEVAPTDAWTLQDFVSMCASTGDAPVCTLRDD